MKKSLCFLIAVLCLALTACGPGLQDYHYDVADGYMVFRSSAHMISVVPKDGWSSEDETIPEKVVEIAWNDTFVIAKQLGMKRRSPNDPNDSYELPDRNEVSYWILDTSERIRYGPYSEEEFSSKLVDFELTDLVLKGVETYRKKW